MKGCATRFNRGSKRGIGWAPACVDMQSLFTCQKTCALLAAFTSALYTRKQLCVCVCVCVCGCVRALNERWQCRLGLSFPFHWDLPCWCCIFQPSGNDTLSIRDDGPVRAAEHDSTAHIPGIICPVCLPSGTNGVINAKKNVTTMLKRLILVIPVLTRQSSVCIQCGNPVIYVHLEGKNVIWLQPVKFSAENFILDYNYMVLHIVRPVSFDSWLCSRQ